MKDVKFNFNRLSRGVRNNNPGNIRRGSAKWFGLYHLQTDSEFCQFEKMEYGVRALLVLLRTYYIKYNCNTIKKVISRFAPSSENNTNNYIKYVCDFMFYPSDDVRLSLNTCLTLAIPIMIYESGFRMTSSELHKIISKYNLCKSDI